MTRREVGGIVPLDIAGERLDVRIVGALRDVPTLDGGSPGLVVDLAELAELQYAETGAVLTPKEWWLATDEGAEAAAAAALTEQLPAPGAAVLDRVTEGRRLSRNPTAVGVVGGLAMALVAAALFAAVGFAVSVAVALRQRLSELALLRALGVSSRQLAGGLAVEQSLLIGLSLLGGTALGLVLPAVRIDVPWRVVGMLELVIVLAAAAAVLVSGLAMREARVGSLLRTGGDT
jgi:predicted lysophospholipase L1 biosynthesis ABC-type transport system permease subunit